MPLSGVLVGYGRVSTPEQNLARQQAALSAAGCAKSFFDKASPQQRGELDGGQAVRQTA
ncbi:recombinase family protein [Nonomuraea sp. NPDC059194]|uniref:recombinase family protein n=1 Tax=Nonomuraea sp. NPDC059194 TaxID=3346764 RepID=UPI0036A89F6C